MVGRVIGKGGETIKALQQYTGAMIQIDQSCEPTKVTVAGSAQSLQLAVSMVRDIVAGNFKGFALLRQLTSGTGPQLPQGYEQLSQAQPVYVEGYGFVPPSQVRRQACSHRRSGKRSLTSIAFQLDARKTRVAVLYPTQYSAAPQARTDIMAVSYLLLAVFTCRQTLFVQLPYLDL